MEALSSLNEKKIVIHAVLFILGQNSRNVSLQSGTVQGKDKATRDGSPLACACPSEETKSYQQAQPLLGSRVELLEVHSTIPLFPVIHKPFGAVSLQWQMLPAQPAASLAGCSEPGMWGL